MARVVLALDDVAVDRTVNFEIPTGKVGFEFFQFDCEVGALRTTNAAADVGRVVRLEDETAPGAESTSCAESS